MPAKAQWFLQDRHWCATVEQWSYGDNRAQPRRPISGIIGCDGEFFSSSVGLRVSLWERQPAPVQKERGSWAALINFHSEATAPRASSPLPFSEPARFLLCCRPAPRDIVGGGSPPPPPADISSSRLLELR